MGTRSTCGSSPTLLSSLLILLCSLPSSGLLAEVIINEVGASNRAAILDDESDASDWVEILNTGDAPVEMTGWALSDDASDPGKWRFPRTTIAAGERIIVWCSDKDRVAPSSEAITALNSPIPFVATLSKLTDEWKYLAAPPSVEGPPANWAEPDFDDTEWTSTLMPVGFGEDIIVSEIERSEEEGLSALFLRRTINIDDLSTLTSFVVQGRYDDGAVFFINGTRVLDVNYTEEDDPTFQSRARSGTEARTDRRFDLSEHMDLLHDGTNTLGIVILNLRATSSDLVGAFEFGTVPPVYHTNFNLDSLGETLILANEFGELVDVVEIPEQARDRSYGRFPDGDGPFAYMLFPTPREENDSHVSDELINSQVVLEPPSGRYSEAQTVTMSVNIPFENVDIRYTTTGSPPTASSSIYEEPLELRRDSVVRVAAFLGDVAVTDISSFTYWGWAGQGRTLSLPVVSISMHPSDYSYVHNSTQARGPASERQGYMEIFNENGERDLGVNMGMRLHGGAGRGGDFNTKKAYKVYFRGSYGVKKLRYPLIPDTHVEVFDKLVLRANFNDAFRTGGQAAYIRDQVIRDLHADLGATSSHGSWYNLYVNMRYRGVYNIVERMDKNFLASYFPEDGDNWDVIKTGGDVLDGNGSEWASIRQFFQRGNFADPAEYQEAWRRLDVENFTSYMLLNIWSQNHDWPQNNWYAARPRRPDGRWICLIWDAEFGLGRSPNGFNSDSLGHVFGRSTFFTDALRGLLESPEYQTYFISKMNEYFGDVLSPENVIAEIQRHANRIAPDMTEESQLTGRGINVWQANIRATEAFARGRINPIRNYILNSSVFGFPRASSAVPRSVVLTEPTEILLRGSRFTENTNVLFNGVPADKIVFETSRALRATIPLDAAVVGRPTITLSDPTNGTSEITNLLSVSFLEPDIDALVPANGKPGDIILVTGDDFSEGARVEFDGVPSPSTTQIDPETLRVIVPEGKGTVEVRIINTVPIDVPDNSSREFTYDEEPGTFFRRGDSDGDGRVNLTDALVILELLFQNGRPACNDALDVDDGGSVTITDAVSLLNFMFRGGPSPALPFPACNDDPTLDNLECEVPPACA